MMNNRNGRLGKFALWVFIIMIISFAIVSAILATNGREILNSIEEGDFKSVVIFEDADYYKKIDDEKIFDSDEIEVIDVTNISADVNVIKTDMEEVKIHFLGEIASNRAFDYPKLEADLDDGDLVVEIDRKRNSFNFVNFMSEDTRLDIYIPYDYNREIVIKTVSSDVTIDDFELERIEVETVSGDVYAPLENVKYLDVHTTSGDIMATGIENDFYIKTVSGKVELEIESLESNVEVKTVSGKVELELSENVKDYVLYYQTTSGDFMNRKDNLVVDETKSNYVHAHEGDSRREININTVSGDLLITD